MGYIRHHAIIVTSCLVNLESARKQAQEYGLAVSNIVKSPINGYKSFFVAPDGSNEGWAESETGNIARDRFIYWLRKQAYEDDSSPYEWVELQYKDDNRENKITRHSDDRRYRKKEKQDG